MKKYEYKAIDPNVYAEAYAKGQRSGLELLNHLGSEGWLLVRVSKVFQDSEEWVLAREVEAPESGLFEECEECGSLNRVCRESHKRGCSRLRRKYDE